MEVLTAVDRGRIAELRGRHEFFWLDLSNPPATDLESIADLLDLHPAAIEDTLEWDQIPKLDDYGEHVTLVFFSARPSETGAEPLEVHVHVSGGYILTVRRDPCGLESLHEWLRQDPPDCEDQILYYILDALADGWDPVIDSLDRRVDEVEAEVLQRPQQKHLRQIYRLKQDVGDLGRHARPQAEVLPRAVEVIHAMPGVTRGSREWLRDVTTHVEGTATDLDRLSGDLAGLTDTFFNANANRLNRLATLIAVASVFFLWWTLVAGFFGQNFKWLVDSVDTRTDFLVFGVGGLVVPSLLIAWVLYKRRADWW